MPHTKRTTEIQSNIGIDNAKVESEKLFKEVFNHYVDDLYHYGQRITGDKELVKDSIQNLFVDLWLHQKNFTEIRSIKFYLFKALKRIIIKELVKRKKTPTAHNFLEDYVFEVVLSPEAVLITKQVKKRDQKRLIETLNKLPRRQKEAITLKFLDGFSYQEVATIMSMSVNSTYNLIYRGMANLKDKLHHK